MYFKHFSFKWLEYLIIIAKTKNGIICDITLPGEPDVTFGLCIKLLAIWACSSVF